MVCRQFDVKLSGFTGGHDGYGYDGGIDDDDDGPDIPPYDPQGMLSHTSHITMYPAPSQHGHIQ